MGLRKALTWSAQSCNPAQSSNHNRMHCRTASTETGSIADKPVIAIDWQRCRRASDCHWATVASRQRKRGTAKESRGLGSGEGRRRRCQSGCFANGRKPSAAEDLCGNSHRPSVAVFCDKLVGVLSSAAEDLCGTSHRPLVAVLCDKLVGVLYMSTQTACPLLQ